MPTYGSYGVGVGEKNHNRMQPSATDRYNYFTGIGSGNFTGVGVTAHRSAVQPQPACSGVGGRIHPL